MKKAISHNQKWDVLKENASNNIIKCIYKKEKYQQMEKKHMTLKYHNTKIDPLAKHSNYVYNHI